MIFMYNVTGGREEGEIVRRERKRKKKEKRKRNKQKKKKQKQRNNTSFMPTTLPLFHALPVDRAVANLVHKNAWRHPVDVKVAFCSATPLRSTR